MSVWVGCVLMFATARVAIIVCVCVFLSAILTRPDRFSRKAAVEQALKESTASLVAIQATVASGSAALEELQVGIRVPSTFVPDECMR